MEYQGVKGTGRIYLVSGDPRSSGFLCHVLSAPKEAADATGKKDKSNARWWTYDDLLRLLNSVYPTVEERAELFFRMREDKE